MYLPGGWLKMVRRRRRWRSSGSRSSLVPHGDHGSSSRIPSSSVFGSMSSSDGWCRVGLEVFAGGLWGGGASSLVVEVKIEFFGTQASFFSSSFVFFDFACQDQFQELWLWFVLLDKVLQVVGDGRDGGALRLVHIAARGCCWGHGKMRGKEKKRR